MDDTIINQLESILNVVNTDYVKAQDFADSLVLIVEELKKVSDKSDETLEELTSQLQAIVNQTKESIRTERNLTLTGQMDINETISNLKSELLKTFDKSLTEIRKEIPVFEETDLSGIESDIKDVKKKLSKIKEETPEETRDKLEKLKGDERLDRKAVKGLEDIITNKDHQKLIDDLWQRTQFLINRATTSDSGGDTTFNSDRPTTRSGVPVVNVGGTTVNEFLEGYFFPPNSPSVTLATSPTAGIREAGNAITSVDLTPTTTIGGANITSLTITGTDGFSYAYPSPNPTGGTEPTQTDSTGFSTTTSYTATVTDSNGNTGTDTETFTYVFPYYKGVGVQNLTGIATDGGTLTKVVAGNPFTLTLSFTTSNQVPYLVYPASYGLLRKVLDASNFDVSNDWGTQAGGPNTNITPWSTITVTNSFGASVSCYAYQFENLTSTTQTYTFSL